MAVPMDMNYKQIAQQEDCDCKLEKYNDYVKTYIDKILLFAIHQFTNSSAILLEVNKGQITEPEPNYPSYGSNFSYKESDDTITDIINGMVSLICIENDAEEIISRKCVFAINEEQNTSMSQADGSAHERHKLCRAEEATTSLSSNGYPLQYTCKYHEETSDNGTPYITKQVTLVQNTYENFPCGNFTYLSEEESLHDKNMPQHARNTDNKSMKTKLMPSEISQVNKLNIGEIKTPVAVGERLDTKLDEPFLNRCSKFVLPYEHGAQVTESELSTIAETDIMMIKPGESALDGAATGAQLTDTTDYKIINEIPEEAIEGTRSEIMQRCDMHNEQPFNLTITETKYSRYKCFQSQQVDNSSSLGNSPILKDGSIGEDVSLVSGYIKPTFQVVDQTNSRGPNDFSEKNSICQKGNMSNVSLSNNMLCAISLKAKTIVSNVLLQAVKNIQCDKLFTNNEESKEGASEGIISEQFYKLGEYCSIKKDKALTEMGKTSITCEQKEISNTSLTPSKNQGFIHLQTAFLQRAQNSIIKQQCSETALLLSPDQSTKDIIYTCSPNAKESRKVQFACPLEICHEYNTEETPSEADTVELFESQEVFEVNVGEKSLYDNPKFINMLPGNNPKSQPGSTESLSACSTNEDQTFIATLVSPLLEKYKLNKDDDMQCLITKQNSEKLEHEHITSQGESDMNKVDALNVNADNKQFFGQSPYFLKEIKTEVKSLLNSLLDHLCSEKISLTVNSPFGNIFPEETHEVNSPRKLDLGNEQCSKDSFSCNEGLCNEGKLNFLSKGNSLCNRDHIQNTMSKIPPCDNGGIYNEEQNTTTNYSKRKYQDHPSSITSYKHRRQDSPSEETTNIDETGGNKWLLPAGSYQPRQQSDQTVPGQFAEDFTLLGPDAENDPESLYMDSCSETVDLRHLPKATEKSSQKPIVEGGHNRLEKEINKSIASQRPVNNFCWTHSLYESSAYQMVPTSKYSDDKSIKPLPRLQTCKKTRRVGLSRKQRVKPLHSVCRDKRVLEIEQ